MRPARSAGPCGIVNRRAACAGIAMSLSSAMPLAGQTAGSVEVGHGEARLTNSYPAWRSTYARATLPLAQNTFGLELAHRDAFGDDGVFAGASATRAFGADFYATASAGASAGGFFFPRAVTGVMLARKWLARRQLVTTSSFTYFRQKDAHRDVLWTPSVVYWLRVPAVVEGGVSVARSSPGAVVSASPFVAGRVGDPMRRSVSARVSAGREAYTRLGADTALVSFNSHTFSAAWRERVIPDAGFVLEAERYANVAYARTGISLGLFFALRR